MGITGVPAIIKQTKGALAHDLRNKRVQVDMPSMYFSLINTACYEVERKEIRRELRAPLAPSSVFRPFTNEATIQEPLLTERRKRKYGHDGYSSNSKRYKNTDSMDIRREVYTSSVYYGVAKKLDFQLSKLYNRDTTTLHFDGRPSVEKSAERTERNQRRSSQLVKLEETWNAGKIKQTYGQCRQLYRATDDTLLDIANILRDLGWRTCHCYFQVDTHLAQICKDDAESVIITNDSDIMMYGNVNEVTMPVGKTRKLFTFTKTDVLNILELPTSRHLVLAAILTKSDYFAGIPWIGIKTNADIVRGFNLDPPITMEDAVDTYLSVIDPEDSEDLTSDDYRHAIKAFWDCEETESVDAVATNRDNAEEDCAASIGALRSRATSPVKSILLMLQRLNRM
ncbi:hypothetical protein BGX34_005754 [Mortierella sp. NVP85]|nr:hypothetical protein BGX34_005754 [Mortierella sp. NVP85]